MIRHHLIQEPEGILLIDKPQGLTSHDVVYRVRRAFGMKRVGHAGTLDPMATGLLILLIGKATKVSQYLMGLNKTYTGTLRLGQTTDSHDAEGTLLEEKPFSGITQEQVLQAMQGLKGDQYQTPPMFSAKKIDGVPLYKHARKGREIERPARFIRVSRFDLTHMALPHVGFEVHCSKGTYIRVLAQDVGQALGCGAHLSALRRTDIAHLSLNNALTLDTLQSCSRDALVQHLLPAYDAVPSLV